MEKLSKRAFNATANFFSIQFNPQVKQAYGLPHVLQQRALMNNMNDIMWSFLYFPFISQKAN